MEPIKGSGRLVGSGDGWLDEEEDQLGNTWGVIGEWGWKGGGKEGDEAGCGRNGEVRIRPVGREGEGRY